MQITAYTNKGFVREHNEDALSFSKNILAGCSMSSPVEFEIESDSKYFAVIDGMGGYEGGEIAAAVVARAFFEDSEDWNIPALQAKEKIKATLVRASHEISSLIKNNPKLASMGAALAGLIFCSDCVLSFNCGDCRTYLQQGEYLEKLSHDHSIVQELYDRGELVDEDLMRTHKRKNIITSCVSDREYNIEIFFREVPYENLRAGQKFFICSDGVWEALPLEAIEKCHADHSAKEAGDLLAAAFEVKKEDCRDNVSFIVIEFKS